MRKLHQLWHRTICGCHRDGREKLWSGWARLLLPLMTAAAMAWFLVRVIPKPIRATYPCQQAAFPFLSAIVIWLLGLKTGLLLWVRPRRKGLTKKIRFGLITSAIVFGAALLIWAGVALAQLLSAWSPDDPPNSPIGVARGIFPGRVTWVHDPSVTTYNGSSGYYYEDRFTSVTVAESMISQTIRKLTEQGTDATAWDALFRFHNQNRERGNTGYSPGEKIAIKINCNNYSSTTGATHDNKVDATPQMVKALLRQLVIAAGVAQTNITVFDSQRYTTWIRDYCAAEFPGVQFRDKGSTTWVPAVITFATNAVSSASRDLPDFVVNATYMINLAVLKRHTQVVDPANWTDSYGQTAITCCMKNHFGTSGSPSGMHTMIRDWRNGMAKYNALVDLNGSRHLEGKTVLYLLDGVFSGNKHNSGVIKWNMAPFNGNYPCSLFGSLDLVAIDSVALDFLNHEWGLMPNADNPLHEAALAHNPPSGVNYAPDGTRLSSLGVHEHWNSPASKQYSRNLSGSGTGIELVAIRSSAGISVVVTSPLNGAVLSSATNIVLSATAISGYTGIGRVEFYRGDSRLGTGSNAPFSFVWSNAPPGSWQLKAVAVDADNFSATSSVVNVTISGSVVNVAITAPTNTAILPEDSNVSIQASALPLESVRQVEFFRNNTLIGGSSNSPFAVAWSNAPAGAWTLTAMATDTNGAAFNSAPVNVVVRNPRLTVAGALYVDLRATNFSAASGVWTNSGTLGSFSRYGNPTLALNAAGTGIPAVQFHGGDAFIGPLTTADLDGSSDRTVEVWVFNPAPLINEEAMVAWSRRGGPNGYNFAMNYGTNLQYGAASQWGSAYDVGWSNVTNIPPAGFWQHIVYTYDGATTCRVYVNGALRITKTLGGALNSYAGFPILIGASTNTSASPPYTFFFSGFINSVRVHGGALGASGVAANYLIGPNVTAAPLTLALQRAAGAALNLSVNTVPGRAYGIEYSDNLVSPVWLPLGSFQNATGAVLIFNESATNLPHRFYRATATP